MISDCLHPVLPLVENLSKGVARKLIEEEVKLKKVDQIGSHSEQTRSVSFSTKKEVLKKVVRDSLMD